MSFIPISKRSCLLVLFFITTHVVNAFVPICIPFIEFVWDPQSGPPDFYPQPWCSAYDLLPPKMIAGLDSWWVVTLKRGGYAVIGILLSLVAIRGSTVSRRAPSLISPGLSLVALVRLRSELGSVFITGSYLCNLLTVIFLLLLHAGTTIYAIARDPEGYINSSEGKSLK